MSISAPKLDAGQKEALSRLLEAVDDEKNGISVGTLATMLKVSQPHALALVRELEADGHVKLVSGRVVAHPQSITKNFSAGAPVDFGAAAAEIAKSPMIGGMLNALPRTERMGCVGILDVVLAHPKEGVPKSTFARAIPAEKVAELLSSLQYTGAIRMVDDRVYPGQNLPSVINEAAGIKG